MKLGELYMSFRLISSRLLKMSIISKFVYFDKEEIVIINCLKH